MSKKIMLFTLRTFSSTGGIQKMARTLAYSLDQLAQKNNWQFKMLSAYDADDDLMPQYLPPERFKGYNINLATFVTRALKEARDADVVVLTHINMALVGLLIKLVNPKCKIWLVAHGIEVWRPLNFIKRQIVAKCDKIICVSQYTLNQMVQLHKTDPKKCVVLNNAIDPFMEIPGHFEKPAHLLEKYNLRPSDPAIYTLTRLAATEQYKGHEQVIKAIGNLKQQFPSVKYILSGPYDRDEETRINALITEHNVAGSVILTGYIDESELADHFLMADVFALPSKKEGFGIVFIEALACGLPVICGNADGSIDAIRNGELGLAVDVNNQQQLENSIANSLTTKLTAAERKNLQAACINHFNELDYRKKLEELLTLD